ncbi:MAG TPA: aminoglycoside phosphotransferase family protein [Nocardioidaceae bacterium]|nr:aminoglycoside phosphotransferase family protein [Nocardioidaceae bacterium]
MPSTGPTMVPLEGGYSGETFLAEMAGERTVVRIYADGRRGANAAEVDAAVLRLVHGLLPVPEVMEVRRGDGASGAPGLLVTSFLPGTPLDRLLPSAPDGLRRTIGERLGVLLSRLAQMPMPRPGPFVDADLRIGPLPPELAGLPEWVELHRDRGAFAEWSQPDLAALDAVADDAQALLDRLDRTCLVHSDFNPKNLLVDPGTGEVTGLVDWEFAHAGMPVTDLGNLLRFEREPVFADAVLEVYTDRVPDATAGVLDQARAADLFALVELAARRDHNPVARRAHDLLLGIARTGDLHAVS